MSKFVIDTILISSWTILGTIQEVILLIISNIFKLLTWLLAELYSTWSNNYY